jgi:hypothetical protein
MRITVLWPMIPYILVDILYLPNLYCSHIFMVEQQSHMGPVNQTTRHLFSDDSNIHNPRQDTSACIFVVEE